MAVTTTADQMICQLTHVLKRRRKDVLQWWGVDHRWVDTPYDAALYSSEFARIAYKQFPGRIPQRLTQAFKEYRIALNRASLVL